MEVLGHSSFALTMDTYTHVMPVLMRDAAEAMDRALEKSRRAPDRGIDSTQRAVQLVGQLVGRTPVVGGHSA